MKPFAMPGGQLALVLVWLGGAALFCALLVLALHGDQASRQGLLVVVGWGGAALATGVALRRPRSNRFRVLATIWLLLGLSAFLWLRWVANA